MLALFAPRTLLTPRTVQAFRRHPDEPGAWLHKEDWPLRGVWQIAGGARLGSDECHFQLQPAMGLDNIWEVAFLWFAAWRRRVWLKRNARRVPRALWNRAKPWPEALS